jgi:hypothetical protein
VGGREEGWEGGREGGREEWRKGEKERKKEKLYELNRPTYITSESREFREGAKDGVTQIHRGATELRWPCSQTLEYRGHKKQMNGTDTEYWKKKKKNTVACMLGLRQSTLSQYLESLYKRCSVLQKHNTQQPGEKRERVDCS